MKRYTSEFNELDASRIYHFLHVLKYLYVISDHSNRGRLTMAEQGVWVYTFSVLPK